MNLRRTIILGGLGLASLAMAAGGAHAETLKVGVIAPLTGGGAPWGVAAKEAATILARDINAKGGLDVGGKKYQIRIIAYDDQYKAATAVAAYNRLVNEDGVKYMLLHTTPDALALKQNVENDKVMAITSSASSQAIDAKTTRMYRTNSPPENYMPPLVAWFADHIKQRRLALVNPNDELGWGFSKLQESLFKQHGFAIVDNELYERSQQNFQPLFTKVLAQKPDVIDLGSVPPATTGLMVRQLRELGYKGLVIKTSGPSPKEILEAAGKAAAEGMIMQLFTDPSNPGYERIAAAYRKDVGQEPNEMLLVVYDGFRVFFRAIAASGTVNDTAKVAAAFPKVLPMKGTLGDELSLGGRFDHTIMTTTYIGVFHDGKVDILGKAK
ncbi:MAG: ABC transporter substrate-binding protein [Rhodospirillales bacterium]|nr:ABC transporter substrate-binding protein [Rhodospirillales bacterium]MDE2198377.1 ABC transporter substrate-binding protein [Rhodospirillales bacterium]